MLVKANLVNKQLYELTINEALAGLRTGAFSSVQLTQALLDRIDAVDEQVQAYLTVTGDQALERAHAADRQRARGEDAPLLGVPLAVKDVLSTAGVQTTCGSRILEGYKPPFTATAVQRLEGAGMVMLGKTNTDEFAMGSSTENSGYQTTRNPWDLSRVPGGSSGGSAAAVAAGEALGALGTDTGGSVRQPASLCGVVGLKPSYGRISRYGLIAYGSSLDQIGPLTNCVADSALLLGVMAGHDPYDSTSWPGDVPDYSAALTGDISGLRVGVPAEYFIEGIEPAVEERSARQSHSWNRWAQRSRRSAFPTPIWPCPPTTWWPPRKPAPICRATTAFVSVSAQARTACLRTIAGPVGRDSALRSSAGSCWEPMP